MLYVVVVMSFDDKAIFVLDVSNYEVEVSEHLNSVHIEEDVPVDEYNNYDQRQEEPVVEYEYVKAAPIEDSFSASLNVVNHQQEALPAAAEEPIAEPRKFTYASIVCISIICATFKLVFSLAFLVCSFYKLSHCALVF